MDNTSMTIEDYKAIISQQERHIYNLNQLLEILKSFASTLEAKALSESLLYTCLGQIHVLAAGIFSLKQIDSPEYKLDESAIGFDLQPQINYSFKETQGIIPYLNETRQCATIAELEEVLKDTYDLTILKSIKATLAALPINTAMLIEQSSTDMLTHFKLRHFFFNVVKNRMLMATEYGGEEFVLMLYNVTEFEADKVTERIRSAVEHDHIVFNNNHLQVTLSAGYTVFYPEKIQDKKVRLEYLVNLADEAMYNSKHHGRNRVTYLPLDC